MILLVVCVIEGGGDEGRERERGNTGWEGGREREIAKDL